jgi:hypothetical protein
MKLSIEDIFKYSYCLTIDNDRYQYLCDVFKYFKLPIPKKHRGVNRERTGAEGCLLGHLSLVMMARTLDLPYITIFEDDAYPCIDIINKLNFYLEDIPDDCGILCYGHSRTGKNIITNGHYYILNNATGSTAYTVFKSAYDDYILSLEKIRISDMALSVNNFKNSKIKPYWTHNCLFIQKNINRHRMFANQPKIYAYPNNNGAVDLKDTPPEGWLHDIPGVHLPNNNTKLIKHPNWKVECYVNIEAGDIQHNETKGHLIYISPNKWQIEWNGSNQKEYLILLSDNTYEIIKG